MTLNDALSKGAIALACTSLAWLGGSVVGSARDNTRQDERIEQLERRQQSLDETLKQLDASVRALDRQSAHGSSL